jgi:hypothetical protein
MVTTKPVDTTEPKITREEILIVKDENFNSRNACVVSGAATGIGRATATAATANNLMAVGLGTIKYLANIAGIEDYPAASCRECARYCGSAY